MWKKKEHIFIYYYSYIYNIYDTKLVAIVHLSCFINIFFQQIYLFLNLNFLIFLSS